MNKKKMSDRQKTYILMVIPALLLFVAFNTIPLITGAMYSFTNYRGYGSYDFVGLRNYIDLFTDSRVGNSYDSACNYVGHRQRYTSSCTA